MASFNKFNSFAEALTEKKHDLGADTLKVLLTNAAPIATNTVKANLTEITAANGYTAGGATASSSITTGAGYRKNRALAQEHSPGRCGGPGTSLSSLVSYRQI